LTALLRQPSAIASDVGSGKISSSPWPRLIARLNWPECARKEIAYRSAFDMQKSVNNALLGWDHFRTFLAVAREGSLLGAARLLGLTQPTAGRHIDTLERALGVTLFVRSRRGLEITAVARDLLEHAEAMEASHEALVRSASGEISAKGGTVRLTASEIISVEVLPSILAPLCNQHPELAIELVASNRIQNLLRRDSDIAIRMARPDQDAIVAKRIGIVEIGLYAHRSYCEAHGLPASIAELKRHRLIGFDRDDRAFRSATAKFDIFTRDTFGYRCDSDVSQLAAVRAGIGIGGCQHRIAMRDPDLIAILPQQVIFSLEVWAAMHERLKSVRRIRLVFDALCDGLTRYLSPAEPGEAVASVTGKCRHKSRNC
jgi:DNA-binding transcriptional LysR family regulator